MHPPFSFYHTLLLTRIFNILSHPAGIVTRFYGFASPDITRSRLCYFLLHTSSVSPSPFFLTISSSCSLSSSTEPSETIRWTSITHLSSFKISPVYSIYFSDSKICPGGNESMQPFSLSP